VTKEYRPWTPEQAFLLPPSPMDWLPEGHLAYFMLEVVRARVAVPSLDSGSHASVGKMAHDMARGRTHRLDALFYSLLGLTTLTFVVEIFFVFLKAPIEARMGIVQKIFYFHVSSACAFYLGAAACFAGSLAYLVQPTDGRDALARAGAETAVTFEAIVLTTERRFAAALGVLGAANLPIIHYSVQKWGGQHPTVVSGSGGGLAHPDMRFAFYLGLFGFTLLAILFVWARTRVELGTSRLRRAEEDAVDLGLDARAEA
jgi:heme exporter protein C